MAKFKKGDRVRRIKTGEEYVVESVPGMREYDKQMFISSYEGMLLESRGWVFQKHYELITDYQPITPKVGERYRVLKPLLGGGNKAEAKGLPEIITLEESCRGFPYFSCKEHGWHFHGDCLTTEYLELVEDEPKVINGTVCGATGTPFRVHPLHEWQGYTPVYHKETLLTKTKQYMTNLYRRAKLSAAEKVLLKAGYINDDGTPTSKGQEASDFLQFKANEAELVKMAEADLAEEKE